MADLISDGGEFSCNFCTSKLKLVVISSSSTGDSKKLANQGNCFFPPPGGNCTFPPGVPPTPCPGIPPGSVIATGQSTVKIDNQTALGDGCKFICPKGQVASLSSAGQTKAKHDEASGATTGILVASGVIVAIAAAFKLKLNSRVVAKAITTAAKATAKVINKAKNKLSKKSQNPV